MVQKLTKFDRGTARMLGDRIEKALAAVADDLGVAIKLDRARYTDARCTVTLEIGVVGADGAVASKDADAFKAYARVYGLSPDDIGRTFKVGGDTFTIVGARPRAHKRPIVAHKGDGREYVFPSDVVVRALAVQGGK